MSTVILVGRIVARIEGGEWTSEDSEFAKTLRVITDSRVPSLYEPDPDWAAARWAVAELQGRILHTDDPPSLPEGAVW